MGKIKKQFADMILARALSATNKGIKYKLGKGGYNPFASLPSDKHNLCDCSGFVAWCMFLNRKPKESRPWWIETTNIYNDAKGKKEVFVQLKNPEPGCLIVYPDKGKKQGHVAIVFSVSPFEIIDCGSKGVNRRSGKFMLNNPNHIFCTLKEWL